jgi:hypothetical protein
MVKQQSYRTQQPSLRDSIFKQNNGFPVIILPNKFYKFPDHEIFRQISSILKLDQQSITLKRDGHYVLLIPNYKNNINQM